MRDATRDVWRMQEHGERPLHCAAAGDDGIEDGVVLGGDLVLAGDVWQAGHYFLRTMVVMPFLHWPSTASDRPRGRALQAARARDARCWCLPPSRRTCSARYGG